MGVTPECQKAMIQNGVLMKDGLPAAMALMQKDILKITLIEADDRNNLPSSFLHNGILTDVASNPFLPDAIENLAQFDDGIEEIIREGIGFWFDGSIQFVESYEDADVKIIAYSFDHAASDAKDVFHNHDHGDDKILGFATFPINDAFHNTTVSAQPIMGLNLHYSDHGYPITPSTVSHEFGHNLGVRHPSEVFFEMASEYTNNPGDFVCGVEAAKKYIMPLRVDTQTGLVIFENQGLMSAFSDFNKGPTEYDLGAKEFLETGVLPDPKTSTVKP